MKNPAASRRMNAKMSRTATTLVAVTRNRVARPTWDPT